MNRKERRKRSISKTDRTFNVKESELKKIKDQATLVGFEMSIYIPMMVLRDKYGFGKVRLDRFKEQVTSQWMAIQKDNVEIEDMRQLLVDEVGFKIEWEEEK